MHLPFQLKSIMIPVTVSLGLVFLSFYSYLLFHTLVEGFAIFAGFLMFIVIRNCSDLTQNSFLSFIAAGFFWIAGIDLIHTLSYKGMGVLDVNSNIPVQLWIASRYLEALTFLIATFLVNRSYSREELFFNTYGAVAAALVCSIFLGLFPDAYFDESGLTPFKIISEYIIILILICALVLLGLKRQRINEQVFKVVSGVILLTAVSEFAFTLYDDVYGLANMIGHILKFFAFYLIYDLVVNRSLKEPVKALIELQNQLDAQNERFELVLKGSGLGLWDWNPQTGQVTFDERWCEMLGCTLHETPQNIESWSSRVHPDDLEQCYEDIKKHIDGTSDYYVNTHRMQHRDGHWVYILDRGKVMAWDQDGRPIRFSGTHEDVTQAVLERERLDKALQELERQTAQLKRLAVTDELTGLYNRRRINEEIDQEIKRARRFNTDLTLVFLDMDYFKTVNDQHGHLVGDAVLKEVAEVLTSHTRETDWVGRWGGEEFVILYPQTNIAQGQQLAEQLRARIEKHNFYVVGHKSCSLGVAALKPGDNLEQLIDRADNALFEAKVQGRNQVVTAKSATP